MPHYQVTPEREGRNLAIPLTPHPYNRSEYCRCHSLFRYVAKKSLHQGVVAIMRHISQFTNPKYEMNDQLKKDGGAVADLALGKMSKALLQSCLKRNDLNEPLNHHESSDPSQSLVFKSQCRPQLVSPPATSALQLPGRPHPRQQRESLRRRSPAHRFAPPRPCPR